MTTSRLAILARDHPEKLRKLSNRDLAALHYDWPINARPEQLPPAGDWRYWLVLAGRGFGKLLSHDTPLPTPSGWTTMGSIAVGDDVIDEAGRPCSVTAKFSPPVTQAYRVEFSDGEYLVADADHQWVTWTHRDRKQFLRYGNKVDFPESWPSFKGNLLDCHGNVVGEYGPSIKTTQQILDTLTHSRRGDLNHCIPIARPLDLPEQNLPIDPWLLGYWIGNGASGASELTAGGWKGSMDADYVCAMVSAAGYSYSRKDYPHQNQSRIGLLRFAKPHEKLIPAVYLRASIKQRLALLRGLMDSDGCADSAKVEFCSIDECLARQVYELVVSLGERAGFYEGDATIDGRFISRKYRVIWRPTIHNPFGLPRKANRVLPIKSQGLRLRHRMITAVVPVATPAMSCITVDSPNSMYLAGRGMIPTHNSRLGAEWVRAMAKRSRFITIVGATANDARTIMCEGESGILACCPDGERPKYMAHKGELHWPNGSKTQVMGAEEPERFRGKQHEFLWLDELASWRYPESWDQLMMGLRLGSPRAVITTTPRPTPIIRRLLEDPHTHVTRGSTYDNRANLATEFFDAVIKRYEGTRLGRQELNAEVLTDNPGALWQRDAIDASRVHDAPDLSRVVIGVDPAATGGEDADMTGIVVAGLGTDKRGYVLADYTLRGSPETWAKKVVWAAAHHKADRVVVEVNNGGDMCESVLRHVAPNLPITKVRASHGKYARAEPVAALYEQGRVSHVGCFAELEDQLCDYVPGEGRRSPDRLDALVWAMTHLMPPTSGGDAAFANQRMTLKGSSL